MTLNPTNVAVKDPSLTLRRSFLLCSILTWKSEFLSSKFEKTSVMSPKVGGKSSALISGTQGIKMAGSCSHVQLNGMSSSFSHIKLVLNPTMYNLFS